MSNPATPIDPLLLNRQMAELALLHSLATAASEAEGVDSLIELAVRAIGEQLYPGVDFGVGLVDSAANVVCGFMIQMGKPMRINFPIDQGVLGKVLATGIPIRLNDVRLEPCYVAVYPEIRSELCVPLHTNERIVGVLNAESTQLNYFNDADERLLTTFAGQLAVAIEKLRLYQRAVRTAQRQQVLVRTSQEISASLDLEHVYQAIHRAIAQLMPCDDLVITLMDNEHQEIEAVYLVEGDQRLPPGRFPASKGLSGYVINTKQTLKIDDFSKDYTHIPIVIFGEDRTRSALVVPLLHKGHAIGALSTQSFKVNAYTSDDQDLLEMLGAHAAIAVENARLFAEVQKLASHDSLTGMYNRHHFYLLARKEVDQARRYHTPLCMLLIDIDYFKAVNDTFGHIRGDEVLQQVAQLFATRLREADILGRYGGEEFVAMLPNTDLTSATAVAERLRQGVVDLQICPGKTLMTISVGVASWDDSHINLEGFINCADQALYRAKQERNRVSIAIQ
jgi:diguanylate cyclase (GGDEF)-like protein